MLRKHSSATYATLIILGIIGAWLTGLFGDTDQVHDITGKELLGALLGFGLFVGALIGIALLVRRKTTALSPEQLSEWDRIRARGRGRYIRAAVVKGLLAGVLALSWPFMSDYQKTGSMRLIIDSWWIYLVLFLTCILAMYYAAIRTWNGNEKEYQIRHSE
jgi:hypothetical protein